MKNIKALLTVALFGSAMVMNAESYKIPVGEFDQLVLNDNINVVYNADMDKAGLVCFEADANFAHYVMAECKKGKLKIQLEQPVQKLENKPTIYVYSSFLNSVENMKDSTIVVESIKPASEIKIEVQNNGRIIANDVEAVNLRLKLITGKGYIKASGKCKQLNVGNLGTGVIEADDVVAKDVKCKIMGTGTIGCYAVETLHVTGMGTGKVYYKGKPESIKTSKIGPIKLIPLEGEDFEEKVDVPEETTVKEEPVQTAPVEVKAVEEQPKPVEVKAEPAPVAVEEDDDDEPIVVINSDDEEEEEPQKEDDPSIKTRQRVVVDEPEAGSSLGIEL